MKILNLKLLFIGMLCLSIPKISAQDYPQVDATIQFYPNTFETPEELSYFITRDFETEEDKVRAIYGWIIHNIKYDPDEYKSFNYTFKNDRERNAKEEKNRKLIIQNTISTGNAVCEGYAMLFEKLCELQGIQNYLVRGDVKGTFTDIGRPFKKIHMWNVAYIDGKPYLFDPTWGAGKYTNRFIKEPSYYYYKTDPEVFIKNHYPDLVSDAFLEVNYSRQFFSKLPLIIKRSLTMKDVVKPASGVLYRSKLGAYIHFQLKSEAPKRISYNYGFTDEKVRFSEKDGELTFVVPVKDSNQLLIYFDGQPALGYILK